MSRRKLSSARRFSRIAVAALTIATTTAAGTGVASAAGHAEDVIAFTSHAYLAPQPDGSARALLVSDTCTIKSDGGAAKACRFKAFGTIRANGSGEAKAVLIAGDRVITFDETFTATGPTTGSGTGSAREMGRDGVRSGTMTALFELAPTANPSVLLDSGTITVTH